MVVGPFGNRRLALLAWPAASARERLILPHSVAAPRGAGRAAEHAGVRAP